MRRPSDTYDVPRKCKHITQLTDTYYFVSMFDVVVAYLQQVQFAPLFAPPKRAMAHTPHDLWCPTGSQVGTMDTTMDSWSCLELARYQDTNHVTS